MIGEWGGVVQSSVPKPKEVLSAGRVVKAMIINGLGFMSAPLYLCGRASSLSISGLDDLGKVYCYMPAIL
ncbi:MAG: DUF4277 domain-containing protein [Coleofasciculus sp. S288]|nr:DUF4277 domain-containing protein [Coleofasciculus sp. S288]